MILIDASEIGILAAKAMDHLTANHDGQTIRTAALIVEVDDGSQDTEIIVFSAEDRAWLLLAFCHEAVYALEDQMAASREEAD